MLHAMFPKVEVETIRFILEAYNGNVEVAIEALLSLATPSSSAESASSPLIPTPRDAQSGSATRSSELEIVSQPVDHEQQIAQDEALARQLQQQLAWEEEVEEMNRAGHGQYVGAYPGGGVQLSFAQRMTVAEDPQSSVSISSGLSSIGSAMYSAGAATVDTASSLVSTWWWRCISSETMQVRALEVGLGYGYGCGYV